MYSVEALDGAARSIACYAGMCMITFSIIIFLTPNM